MVGNVTGKKIHPIIFVGRDQCNGEMLVIWVFSPIRLLIQSKSSHTSISIFLNKIVKNLLLSAGHKQIPKCPFQKTCDLLFIENVSALEILSYNEILWVRAEFVW